MLTVNHKFSASSMCISGKLRLIFETKPPRDVQGGGWSRVMVDPTGFEPVFPGGNLGEVTLTSTGPRSDSG